MANPARSDDSVGTKRAWARRGRRAALWVLLGAGAGSCGPQDFLAIMPGMLNEPSNRTLRREILSFGTATFCAEMMKRNVPLKFHPDDPSLGRMFPSKCQIQSRPNGDLYVVFGGTGYGWSNLTKRVGFNVHAAIQYEQDFRMSGSDMYIYFRPGAPTTDKRFEQLMVEESALPAGPAASVLPGGTPQGFVNQIGDGMLQYQLGEGFTVIRKSNGDASFAVGTLEPGKRPVAPFQHSGSRFVYANERVEIHQNQRDFVGPIEVGAGKSIYLTLMVEGAPQVDVQVYPRRVADPWLQQYITTAAVTAPPEPPVFDDVVTADPTGKAEPFRKTVKVEKGGYYVVLDHTAVAGKTSPPNVASDDRAALVNLAIEVGD